MKKITKVMLVMFISFIMFNTKVYAASGTDPNFCLKTSAIWQFVGYGLYALKIIIPLIIIIFGIIDFAKATMSGDDKAIKQAASSVFKRLVMGIAIFFIPTIVTVVFNLIENITNGLDAIAVCETCLLNPTSETCNGYISEAECLRNPNSDAC